MITQCVTVREMAHTVRTYFAPQVTAQVQMCAAPSHHGAERRRSKGMVKPAGHTHYSCAVSPRRRTAWRTCRLRRRFSFLRNGADGAAAKTWITEAAR